MYLSVVRPSRLRRGGGFTLIEILVAMLIGVGVAATVAWFGRTQFLAMEDQVAQLDIQTSTRAIVDVFARDVRRAGMDPTCAKNVTAVVDASPTALRFQADLNSNGAVDAASEDLLYRLVDGVRVERGQGTTVEPLLEDVDLSGSRIRYFDAAGFELLASASLTAAQRALIRRVRLELDVRVPARSGSGAPDLTARAATDVELRNRFFVGVTGCS